MSTSGISSTDGDLSPLERVDDCDRDPESWTGIEMYFKF